MRTERYPSDWVEVLVTLTEREPSELVMRSMLDPLGSSEDDWLPVLLGSVGTAVADTIGMAVAVAMGTLSGGGGADGLKLISGSFP